MAEVILLFQGRFCVACWQSVLYCVNPSFSSVGPPLTQDQFAVSLLLRSLEKGNPMGALVTRRI